MNFRQWLIAYNLRDGYMTDREWDAEVKKFRTALVAYWKARGVSVSWKP